MKPVAEEKEITLEFEVSENIAVYADEKMICTVIRNLVSNALKFTPRKGKIKVTSEQSTNNQIIVSIEDNGVGMNKDVLSTFFDNKNTAFTKGTEDEPGSGFGLILVKEFVEKNNGELIIESKEGQKMFQKKSRGVAALCGRTRQCTKLCMQSHSSASTEYRAIHIIFSVSMPQSWNQTKIELTFLFLQKS